MKDSMHDRFKPCCGKGFLVLQRGIDGTLIEATAGDLNYPQTQVYLDDDLQLTSEVDINEDFSSHSLTICLGCFKPAEWLLDLSPSVTKSFIKEEDD